MLHHEPTHPHHRLLVVPQIEAISMDMGPAYAKSVAKPAHAPAAEILVDPVPVCAGGSGET